MIIQIYKVVSIWFIWTESCGGHYPQWFMALSMLFYSIQHTVCIGLNANRNQAINSAAMTLTHLPLDKMTNNLADDIFNCIFFNENAWILNKISLRFVPKGPINNIPALVQIMAWRWPGEPSFAQEMACHLCGVDVLHEQTQTDHQLQTNEQTSKKL